MKFYFYIPFSIVFCQCSAYRILMTDKKPHSAFLFWFIWLKLRGNWIENWIASSSRFISTDLRFAFEWSKLHNYNNLLARASTALQYIIIIIIMGRYARRGPVRKTGYNLFIIACTPAHTAYRFQKQNNALLRSITAQAIGLRISHPFRFDARRRIV